jgi:RHS repeat-associated protein
MSALARTSQRDCQTRTTGENCTASESWTRTKYQYDAVGNRFQRTSSVAPVPPATYSFDANDRLATDTYDADGNTTASSGSTYAYDFENRLVSQNNAAVTMIYDGDGNRVAKTTGGVTIKYLVDDRNVTGYAQVLEEVFGGTVQRVYTYGLNRISQSQAGGTSFYGYDGHASVRLLTDAAGAVTDRYDYDAFGNKIASLGTTPNDFLYSGEQHDATLGLYYLRTRFYDPSFGRFRSVDSFEGSPFDPKTLHQYLYVHNNPVNSSDPNGNFTLQDEILTVSIIGVLEGIAIVHFAQDRLAENGGKFDGVFASVRYGGEFGRADLAGGADIVYGHGHFCVIPTIDLGFGVGGGGGHVSWGFGGFVGNPCGGGGLSGTATFPLSFFGLGGVLAAPLAPKFPFTGFLSRLNNAVNRSSWSVSIGYGGESGDASFGVTHGGRLGVSVSAGIPVSLDSYRSVLQRQVGSVLDDVLGALESTVGWGTDISGLDPAKFLSLIPPGQ